MTFQSRPEIRVDPQKRCAALVIFNTKLVIIPFKQPEQLVLLGGSSGDLSSDPYSTAGSGRSNPDIEIQEEIPVGRHVIIDLLEYGIRVSSDSSDMTHTYIIAATSFYFYLISILTCPAPVPIDSLLSAIRM